MSKLLSVVVPIYNVEPYIDHCIESICRQTYTNLEILLVDDGTKDSSGRICDEWAERDVRIRVFHTENGGQSCARNVGLAHAEGELIGFVDGDDAITPVMYERLADLLEQAQADISECNFTGRKAPEPDVMAEGETMILTGRAALIQHLDITAKRRFPSTSVWSKLFRREVLEGLRFPEGKIHEEYALLSRAIYRCGKYAYKNEKLYERTLRDDSTTAAAFSPRAFDKLAVFEERDDFLISEGEDQLLALSRAQRYDLMLHFYNESKRHGLEKEAELLYSQLKQEKADIRTTHLPLKRKALLHLLTGFKNGYDILRSIGRN